jgi:hypothetical protein
MVDGRERSQRTVVAAVSSLLLFLAGNVGQTCNLGAGGAKLKPKLRPKVLTQSSRAKKFDSRGRISPQPLIDGGS